MEADNIFDPNYIFLGVKDAVYRNQEWFSYNDMWIRAPRYASQSAIVILGSDFEKISLHFKSTSGWVVILPTGYFGTVDLSNTPDSQRISNFYSFLKRIGVQELFTTIIALQNDWHVGTSLVDCISGSKLIYCAHDAVYLSSEDGLAALNGAIQHVKNNSVRFPLTTFVLPLQVKNMPEFLDSGGIIDTVFNDFANDGLESAHFWSICSSLDSVIISGGSIYQYLSQQFMGPKFSPYGGFLDSLSDNPDVTHMSGSRFTLAKGSLKVTGFSLSQSRPARSWGSYSHKLIVKNVKTAGITEYQLGSLKRSILDSLPLSSNDSTNAFGAFALPKNQGKDLSKLSSGTYQLHIEDSTGYNIINPNRTEIIISSNDQIYYDLKQDGKFLLLTVK